MKVGSSDAELGLSVEQQQQRSLQEKFLLLLVWISLGVFPLILRVRSFIHFVTPHKISLHLIVPVEAVKETTDLRHACPVKELYVANVYWNVLPTHYMPVQEGTLCHFVIPQYNVHGVYFLGIEHSAPSSNTQGDCEDDSFFIDYYFYHGSFGYYAFYEEGAGSYCAQDEKGYVLMKGLGTFDSNGAKLATNQATTGYRTSYWYGIIGSLWIAYRCCILRRSFILCLGHSTRCGNTEHHIPLAEALVYVQESMRLSAHNANNYHRLILVYVLMEGVMSELFMLIALEGGIGRLQYISLGYNLSGVMSMLFEMIESSGCLKENIRCFLKRLLFNHETVLIGELVCAGLMQKYLTSLNRSSLKDTDAEAVVASYYVWSLVGHSSIVLGCVLILVAVRALGAVAYVRCRHGSFAVLTAPCCIDTVMGVRCKLIMLAGYIYENGKLYYRSRTLATFGILRMVCEDGSEYVAFHKLTWISPKQDLFAIGIVSHQRVTWCKERPCDGIVSMFSRKLGGSSSEGSYRRRRAGNRVVIVPTTLDLLQVS
ncbi:unnamed protein product [Phytophthora lilii]|uniref:Unnamed protein product n=1 Tax=Phytophthora lilii TaxID=2077276 RepID=A0A9W6U9G3_9STRA|nr:unnamed protein product [Phytophthora lilii]